MTVLVLILGHRGKDGRTVGGTCKGKVKVKVTLEQVTKVQRGSRCIALLFLQPRLYMGVGGQRHAPAALSPGKTRYPLYRRLGAPQGRSGRVREISPPPGFDPRTVKPVAGRYPGPCSKHVEQTENCGIKLIIRTVHLVGH